MYVYTNKMVPCPDCERSFKTHKAMKKHHTKIHNAHLLRFPCEWCNTRYLSEANLRRHAEAKHPEITIKIPTYSIFNQTPKEAAAPVKPPVITPSTSDKVQFRVVPGTSRYKGAPTKVIKHQSVKDRPVSPAVFPSPTTPDTSGTPLKDEAYLSTLGHLEAVNIRLMTDQPRGESHNTKPDKFLQLRKDLASTSEETSPNASGSKVTLTSALKRKHPHTRVNSGSKKSKPSKPVSTIYTHASAPSTDTSGEYNPHRPWLTDTPKQRIPTPTLNTSGSTPISSLFSSVGSLSLSFNTSSENPLPNPASGPTYTTPFVNTEPFNITTLVDALGATRQLSPSTPSPFVPIDPPIDPPIDLTTPGLVDYTYTSSEEDRTIPDRDVMIYTILDLVERYDNSKTNVMKDLLDMLFPKA